MKLYVSAMFDCFDLAVLGLAMATNMKAPLCARTLKNAHKVYPGIEGAIYHSDRGVQYTSDCYRRAVQDCHITQSMNSDGGRCHDNARCERMWARMKSELLYDRYDTEKMTVTELKETSCTRNSTPTRCATSPCTTMAKVNVFMLTAFS